VAAQLASSEAPDQLGIRLPHERPGKHRIPCPQCKKDKGDDALKVTVTPRRWAFWKCYRCGLEGKAPLDDGEHHHSRERRPRPAPVTNPLQAQVFSGLSPWGRRIWDNCKLITKGSLPSTYFEVRGCAEPQDAVRWHPALKHRTGHVGPAIVALVTDIITGEPVNLHRTWLRPDGTGKADVMKPRLLLKGHRAHGGVIRLFPDDEVTTGLCLAEGLETALTAAHGFTPVWATVSAGNLAEFPVLDGVESLTIAIDYDKAGLDAFNAVAARWIAAGREVRQWQPPEHGMDINDWLGAAA
jgi:putative DNA primase/helicase